MSQTPEPQFLDVARLLRDSQPIRRGAWVWYMLGFMALLVFVSSVARAQQQAPMEVAAGLGMLVTLGLGFYLMATASRAMHTEQDRLSAIEELIQLRRWSEAASLLDNLLSGPTQTPAGRFQAIIYLAAVLARYHRFHDAVDVYEHLLAEPGLDAGGQHGLRLGRAMAMLRDDRLYDADRAIVELRRGIEKPSAGLELVELYRDVKTGHSQDALDRFTKNLPVLQQSLGCRIADAWGLAAAASFVLGDATAAACQWILATSIAPAAELTRRYPELSRVAEACPAAVIPAEAL